MLPRRGNAGGDVVVLNFEIIALRSTNRSLHVFIGKSYRLRERNRVISAAFVQLTN